MDDLDTLYSRRFANWSQTPDTRAADPDAAAALIERVGIATHYPASPEIPDLFRAYVGDPNAEVEASWDSPSGQIYEWRWLLGRRNAAFYSAIVRKRPTWVAWRLVPSLMRLRGEMRSAAEVYADGQLSVDARRVADALQDAGRPLGTAALRERAGFPTGKDHRASYLKAVEELETRLMVAKVFVAGAEHDDESTMSHVLVSAHWPEMLADAHGLTLAESMDAVLHAYLPTAVFALPVPLAKHLGVAETDLREGLDRLVARGKARVETAEANRGKYYVWAA